MSAELSLVAAVDQYCSINSKVTSSGTRRLYAYACGTYEKFLERPALVADLNDVTFAKWKEWRQTKVAHETVRGECCKLLALWRWCASGKRRWIEEPEVTAPPQVYLPPKALTEEQLTRLWRAASLYRYRIGPVPGNVYLMALLYTIWDSSERLGAIHKIEREHVDLRSGWLSVPPNLRKGGRKGRAYKVRAVTCRALAELMRCYDGPTIFGAADLRTIWHCFGHLRIAADLPRWVTPHSLRKSHASHLKRLGGNPRDSLGHESEATTKRYYEDPTITSQGRQPCDVLFDPGAKRWWRLFG